MGVTAVAINGAFAGTVARIAQAVDVKTRTMGPLVEAFADLHPRDTVVVRATGRDQADTEVRIKPANPAASWKLLELRGTS